MPKVCKGIYKNNESGLLYVIIEYNLQVKIDGEWKKGVRYRILEKDVGNIRHLKEETSYVQTLDDFIKDFKRYGPSNFN